MSVFKTYDIRGIWGQGIDPRLAYRIGRAFGRFLGGRTYMAGHDARLHSAELYREVMRGLVDEGKQVTGIGLASTPYLHYSQIRGGLDGAVMVTASHNPPPYHGFKLFDGAGGSVSYAKGLERIERMVMAADDPAPVPGGASCTDDPLAAYLDFVCAPGRGLKRRFKLVVDVGNGSAGRVFRGLAERLGLDAAILNEAPDGRFPNRDPNPLKPESRRGTAAKVRAMGADFGVILDGDGDRILFVDEQGEAIENYFLSILIAEELLGRNPGAAVVYDLISSRVLPERVRELGGRPEVSRVGYTFIYDKMMESGALFGAETSGHVYFKTQPGGSFVTESAAYALVMLLNLLERKGQPLSALIDPLRGRYVQSEEINIEIADRHKEEALRRVLERYAGAEIDRLDGVSVTTPEYWFNVRPSNTEPLLRLRGEGVDRQTVESRTQELLQLFADLHCKARARDMRLRYNAPVILTFTLLAMAVLALDLYAGLSLRIRYFVLDPRFDPRSFWSYFRLFSHVVGHESWAHLLGNFVFVLLIGPMLEEKYRSGAVLAMLLVTALVTAVANLLLFHSGLMGASGIVFMLILLSSFTNIRAGEIPLTFVLVVLLFLAREVIEALGRDNVSQFAHIMGGLCGASFGFTFTRAGKG